MTLSATDGESGVDQIRYTLDGTDPTLNNGRTYLGARSIASTTTVKYRAYDSAGNAEAGAQPARPDRHDAALEHDLVQRRALHYEPLQRCRLRVPRAPRTTPAVQEFREIRYTTDGSDPTSTNGTVATLGSPFTVSQTTTVKYRAIDAAGNARARQLADHHRGRRHQHPLHESGGQRHGAAGRSASRRA